MTEKRDAAPEMPAPNEEPLKGASEGSTDPGPPPRAALVRAALEGLDQAPVHPPRLDPKFQSESQGEMAAAYHVGPRLAPHSKDTQPHMPLVVPPPDPRRDPTIKLPPREPDGNLATATAEDVVEPLANDESTATSPATARSRIGIGIVVGLSCVVAAVVLLRVGSSTTPSTTHPYAATTSAPPPIAPAALPSSPVAAASSRVESAPVPPIADPPASAAPSVASSTTPRAHAPASVRGSSRAAGASSSRSPRSPSEDGEISRDLDMNGTNK